MVRDVVLLFSRAALAISFAVSAPYGSSKLKELKSVSTPLAAAECMKSENPGDLSRFD